MKDVCSGNFLESVFLANPDYELVCFDRLPVQQRDVLKDLKQDRNFYGILRPREKSALGVKSVSRDTALLYLTLQQPGRIPGYVRATLGDECSQEITRLVLDGVLAFAWEGRFLSGTEAADLILADDARMQAPAGFLERLSVEALLYGQSLGLTDPLALSACLYAYNREPLSPYWKRTLSDSGAVTRYLGIADGTNRDLLDREWLAMPKGVANNGWFAWQALRFGTSTFETSIRCKLYISPKTERLPETLPLILAVLTRTRVQHFKIGKDASGLLRPDKMVAYFTSAEDLIETADELSKELKGCAAQGVPFTAELSGDGLLSAGIDPPSQEQVLPWIGRESWRLWVTNRLASALIAAMADDTASPCEPWQFARRRLRLEGIDTTSWTTVGTNWQAVLARRTGS